MLHIILYCVEYHAVCSFDSISHGLGTQVEIIAEQYYDTAVTCKCVHVLVRDEKEGRSKQARSNKQQGKATQHTQGSHFSLSCLG